MDWTCLVHCCSQILVYSSQILATGSQAFRLQLLALQSYFEPVDFKRCSKHLMLAITRPKTQPNTHFICELETRKFAITSDNL